MIRMRQPSHYVAFDDVGSFMRVINKILLSIIQVSSFLTIAKGGFLFARAQETPTLNVSRWSIENIFKTNLCERQQQLTNGEITLDRALAGLNISVALTLYESSAERQYFDLKEDESGVPRIRRHNPGFYVRVLDDLAERAGFQWRHSFASVAPIDPLVDPSDEGKTWTDLLTWELDVYDVSVDFWMKAVSRMEVGVYFPTGFLDSSLILVQPPMNINDSSSMLSLIARNTSIWSFLVPFEVSVWLLIGLAIFFTGCLYWILEYLERDAVATLKKGEEDDHHLTDLSDATFNAAVTFSQHFQFHPRSNATRLLSFSWAFWAVIVGSAYLANLASVLVEQRHSHYAAITIETIAEEQRPLCVHAAALPDIYLSGKFPTANFVRKFREEEMFEALQIGECAAAVLSLNVWQTYERSATFNPGCKLMMNRNVIKINPGCFATSVDSEGICSSLLGFVFDYHFSIMRADGTLEELWNEHLDHVGTQQCGGLTTSDDSDDLQTLRLSVSDLGGIFVLHAIFSFAALFVALIGYTVRRRQGTQQDLILKIENRDLSSRGEQTEFPSNSLRELDKAASRRGSASQEISLRSILRIDVDDIQNDDLQRILSTARRIGRENVPASCSNEDDGGNNLGAYAGQTSMAASFARSRRASIFNAF